MLAINTGKSIVLGSSVNFEVGPDEKDTRESTVLTAHNIEEDANALYLAEAKDQRALDQLAQMLNSYADEQRGWDQVEICNELVMVLRDTRRTVSLEDD